MSEFFVTIEANEETKTHIMHKHDCSELPAKETLRHVGSYASSKAAFKICSQAYEHVSCCPTCLSDAYPSGTFEYSAEKAEASV